MRIVDEDTVSIAKRRWENRALLFGTVSICLNMCALPTSGVPLGIPMGIFAVAFGIISAKGGIRGRAVAGIITGIFGIFDRLNYILNDTFCYLHN